MYESEHYCLNIEYKSKGSKKFGALHSDDPDSDSIEVTVTTPVKHQHDSNPFKEQ